MPTHTATEAAKQSAEAGAKKGFGSILLHNPYISGSVISAAWEVFDRSRSAARRVGGFTGSIAGIPVGGTVGTAVGTMVGGPLGGFVGFVAGAAAEMVTYAAFEHTFGAMEEANARDQARMRSATRVGFQVSDTFHTNSRMMLTQRQRSLRAIQGSVLNARSSIGNEAAMMHRGVDEYLEG